MKAFGTLYAGRSSKFFYRSWKKSYKAFNKAVKRAFLNGNRILYQAASLVRVLISTDNLLRWLERGGKSYWYWLCSGSMAMVVLEQSPWLCNLCIGQT